jgi:hypothetical protein
MTLSNTPTTALAIRAANSVQGDSSGFTSMKLSVEKHSIEALQDSTDNASEVCMASSEDINTITVSPSRNCAVSSAAASASSDTNSPLPTDSENHAPGSQLHTQLLEEYCFVRPCKFNHTPAISKLIICSMDPQEAHNSSLGLCDLINSMAVMTRVRQFVQLTSRL